MGEDSMPMFPDSEGPDPRERYQYSLFTRIIFALIVIYFISMIYYGLYVFIEGGYICSIFILLIGIIGAYYAYSVVKKKSSRPALDFKENRIDKSLCPYCKQKLDPSWNICHHCKKILSQGK